MAISGREIVTKYKVDRCEIHGTDIGTFYIGEFLEVELGGIPEIIAFFVVAFNCWVTGLVNFYFCH